MIEKEENKEKEHMVLMNEYPPWNSKSLLVEYERWLGKKLKSYYKTRNGWVWIFE